MIPIKIIKTITGQMVGSVQTLDKPFDVEIYFIIRPDQYCEIGAYVDTMCRMDTHENEKNAQRERFISYNETYSVEYEILKDKEEIQKAVKEEQKRERLRMMSMDNRISDLDDYLTQIK